MVTRKTANKFLREWRRIYWQRSVRYAKYWQEVRSVPLYEAATKLRHDVHRGYWLLRLRRAERQQAKALADSAEILRRMCGTTAGPHLKKLYASRVYVFQVIGEVISPHKSREDLTVPEIQLVMFEFLRRRASAGPEELPA
jgi:hypothetical protein